MFPIMAELIRSLGAVEGLEAFRRTVAHADVLRESSDSADALVGMFQNPRAEETVELDRIPRDCPSLDRSRWGRIAVPTLVLVNHRDPIHPYAMGEVLSKLIPRGTPRVDAKKCVDLLIRN